MVRKEVRCHLELGGELADARRSPLERSENSETRRVSEGAECLLRTLRSGDRRVNQICGFHAPSLAPPCGSTWGPTALLFRDSLVSALWDQCPCAFRSLTDLGKTMWREVGKLNRHWRMTGTRDPWLGIERDPHRTARRRRGDSAWVVERRSDRSTRRLPAWYPRESSGPTASTSHASGCSGLAHECQPSPGHLCSGTWRDP